MSPAAWMITLAALLLFWKMRDATEDAAAG